MANIKKAYGTQGNDDLFHNGTEKYHALGYGGRDFIIGNSNNDYLDGGSGNDRIYGYGGNDFLVGGSGTDYFDGGSGSDTVSYYDSSANINANLTTNIARLSNSSYSEILISIENLIGGSGNDTLTGDYGKNTLSGHSGNDYLRGYGGNDYLYGGHGNDILVGGSGNDTLNGGRGNDNLYGGGGNDLINGYGHSYYEYDNLYGGSGSDTFVIGSSYNMYYKGYGFATIKDWDASSDFIQAKGSSSQYSMRSENWSGTSAFDTAIYSGNDLIAVVQDTTNVSFSRDFKFV